MKKFYTLFATCAVALGAVAAPQFSAVKLADAKTNTKQLTISDNARGTLTAKPGPSLRPADPNLPNCAGNYILSGTVNDKPFGNGFSVEQAKGSNKATINGFIFSDANPVPATIANKTFPTNNGSVQLYCLTIPGDGQITLYTYGGQAYSLYLFNYGEDGKTPSIYSDDIDLIINGDELFPVYEGDGIAWVNAQGSGNWISDLDIIKSNSTFTGTETYYGQGGGTEDVTAYQYATIDEKNTVTVEGFAGISTAVFEYFEDEDGALLVAENQVPCGVKFNDGTTSTFYANCINEVDTYILVGEIENDLTNNTSVITFPYWMIMGWMDGEAAALYDYKDSKMTLPFTVGTDGSGVESIAADANNAPVEYYNLQGVRVMNPEAGQLVIKRQGNEVSKLIVR